MQPKLIRQLLISVAVLALAVWLWMGQTRWSGMVVDTAGKPVEGATVLLVNGPKVVQITSTESDGSFSVVVGARKDPALRLIMCKMMYEPSALIPRGKSGPFTLDLAKPDIEDPALTAIKAGLPPECQ